MLVLASASPRRKELLAQAGYLFETMASSVPEDLRPHHLHMRGPGGMVSRADRLYDWLAEDSLVNGTAVGHLSQEWAHAQAAAFAPTNIGPGLRPPEVSSSPAV